MIIDDKGKWAGGEISHPWSKQQQEKDENIRYEENQHYVILEELKPERPKLSDLVGKGSPDLPIEWAMYFKIPGFNLGPGEFTRDQVKNFILQRCGLKYEPIVWFTFDPQHQELPLFEALKILDTEFEYTRIQIAGFLNSKGL